MCQLILTHRTYRIISFIHPAIFIEIVAASKLRTFSATARSTMFSDDDVEYSFDDDAPPFPPSLDVEETVQLPGHNSSFALCAMPTAACRQFIASKS